MKLASWNVNGIRAASRNGLPSFVKSGDFDVILIQEVKANGHQIPEEFHHAGYFMDVYPAKKAGYSGVMALYKEKPLSLEKGMGAGKFDDEGRVQIIEYDSFFILNTYFPNSQRGLARLGEKLEFNTLFLKLCQDLRKAKPVVICGDFNVAHEDIDIARPKDNRMNAGFTQEERDWMTELLASGYADTFRMFNSEGGNYTWWSYRFNARERNIGWRIDYFVVSDELKDKVVGAGILSDVKGSDHVPVYVELDV